MTDRAWVAEHSLIELQNCLYMSMPDEHAANPVFKEIARNPINILIDRIVWSAMDEQVTVRKPRKAASASHSRFASLTRVR